MSFFQAKTSQQVVKKPFDSRTTLDNLHQHQISEFQREKSELQTLEKRIEELEAEIPNLHDIIVRTQKEELLHQLQEKKTKLTNNEGLYDYFFETGELLYKYYDLQEKIQKGEAAKGKTVKAKPGSVLAALHDSEQEKEEVSFEKQASKGKEKEEGREVLLEKYLSKVNPEYAKAAPTTFDDPHGTCDLCEKEMTFSANEALFYCPSCGNQEFVLIDSDKPSYKDPPREVTYYAYKRINHFNELLAQFQAKESTEIPEEVFQAIMEELKKERITSTESVKPTKIREILKKLRLTHFYEHVPYILNRINGKNAPIMPREVEDKLRFMFKEIQSSFIKHCPKDRCNFLSYSYVLYKFCELLDLDEFLACFPLLKNRDKLYNQDKIWAKICEDMQWQFIRSL